MMHSEDHLNDIGSIQNVEEFGRISKDIQCLGRAHKQLCDEKDVSILDAVL